MDSEAHIAIGDFKHDMFPLFRIKGDFYALFVYSDIFIFISIWALYFPQDSDLIRLDWRSFLSVQEALAKQVLFDNRSGILDKLLEILPGGSFEVFPSHFEFDISLWLDLDNSVIFDGFDFKPIGFFSPPWLVFLVPGLIVVESRWDRFFGHSNDALRPSLSYRLNLDSIFISHVYKGVKGIGSLPLLGPFIWLLNFHSWTLDSWLNCAIFLCFILWHLG